MFTWDTEKIRFLRDASERTPFNDVLAARAAVQFSSDAHVLDAGCGLGYLSLALAKYCARVTAADTSREALSVLRENLHNSDVRNVAILEADVFSLSDSTQFDGIAFCFFGATEEILRCVRSHCRGKGILFKKNWETHRFTAKETPLTQFTFRQTCDELMALDVPFLSESFTLEMGQPFRSLADAMRFFQLYTRESDGDDLPEAELRLRLTKTDSMEFPFYLSSAHPVGMITVEAGDIPDTIIPIEGLRE